MTPIVIADDQVTNRNLLKFLLEAQGYTTIETTNGAEALTVLQTLTAPAVALIDWEMPEIDGVEVCRRVRQNPASVPVFLILVTVRDSQIDIVNGLEGGAHDYIVKPFDYGELLARVKIGVQMVELQQTLLNRAQELREALEKVKQLSGLLPICSYCHKIRNDNDHWEQIEQYISHHSEANFSHGFCPECYQTQIVPQFEALGIKTDLRLPGFGGKEGSGPK